MNHPATSSEPAALGKPHPREWTRVLPLCLALSLGMVAGQLQAASEDPATEAAVTLTADTETESKPDAEPITKPDTQIVEAADTRLENDSPETDIADADVASTDSAEILDADEPDPDQPYAQLRRQIELQEYQPSLQELDQIIVTVERDSNRYSADLAEPLLLRGDVRLALQDVEGALDDYSRSVHVQRVNNGLHHASQVDAVYREANALKLSGQLGQASRREEYAYEILRKHHGPYSPDILPGLFHLAKWHEATNNVFAARRLYGQAVVIMESSKDDEFSTDLIKPLRGLATTYRLERFPPFYSNESIESLPTGNSTTEYYRGQRPLTLNNFPAGEQALTRIVRIRETKRETEPVALAEAIIELADWNLLFEKYQKAGQLYQHAQILLTEAHPQAADDFFAKPALLHFPKPLNPKRPPDQLDPKRQSGHVTLGYVISSRGKVTRLQTLGSEPAGLMDFRVRKSMRAARFRPPLIEGSLTEAVEQSYRYDFHYYPNESSENETAPAESKTETGQRAASVEPVSEQRTANAEEG